MNALQAGTLGGGSKVKSMRHSLSLAGSNAYVNTLVRSRLDRGRGNPWGLLETHPLQPATLGGGFQMNAMFHIL